MQIKRNADGDFLELDGKVRVQRSRRRRTEIATEALLGNDVTAADYQVGRPDARGKVIELGSPMTFIDYLAPERVFYVYAREPVADEVDGKPVTVERFMPKGEEYATEEDALGFAIPLVVEMS
jgi:hypothetical protein